MKTQRDEHSEYPGIYLCGECGGKTHVCERDFAELPSEHDYRYCTDCCHSEQFTGEHGENV